MHKTPTSAHRVIHEVSKRKYANDSSCCCYIFAPCSACHPDTVCHKNHESHRYFTIARALLLGATGLSLAVALYATVVTLLSH